MSMFRRILCAGLFCGLVFNVLCQPAPAPGVTSQAPAQRPAAPAGPATPNIILIVADDLGYGDLGSYGQTRIRTPNLDRLAAEGARFTQFYAGAAVCAPSRSALLTGQHTGRTRIRGSRADASLLPEDNTLAMALQGAGYFTGLVGQWGLGGGESPGAPWEKGFDEFAGYLCLTRAQQRYPAYLDRYDTAEGPRRVELALNFDGGRGQYAPDLLQRAAINFIRIHRPDRLNRFRPIFLLYTPSLPGANDEPDREPGNGTEATGARHPAAEDWPAPERARAARIARLDSYVGEILARLQQHRQDSNTLVLLTSDNGPRGDGGAAPGFFRSSGPLRGQKGELYEGGIRVPLIARWPGNIPAGHVSDEPWAMLDLLPTLAELARLPAPENVDGLSYLPTLLGGTQTNRHEFFYWELHESGFQQAARSGYWKAVRKQAGEPLELYHLGRDPGETENQAAAHPEVAARFEEFLRRARVESADWPVR